MSTFRFLSRARAELEDVTKFYETESPGLGDRFLDQFHKTIRFILMSPESAAPFVGDYRLRRLHTFPYGVIYRIEQEIIIVVAVFHLHRGPDYLTKRLS